ncbi:MAG: NAD(P)-dependent alcohol dehydrogenase [Nocardiopsaceae bacterium]|nr:NAD(P)-dependent alcohol dehydrogenase [Nocardiopsaceae bacterium]
MRTYLFEDTIARESLRLIERPDPVPGDHDIVLRMKAVALNYRDLAIMRGNWHLQVSPPLVPLSDGAGEVIEAGAAVSRFKPGDLACPVYLPDWIDGPPRRNSLARRLGGPSDGVLTELFCLHEDEAVLAPRHLDAGEAATLPIAGLTAWHSLFEYDRLRPDETLLVQGSGGVSAMAIQLARSAGARVIVVTRSGRHAEQLTALGADHVLTSGNTPAWPDDVIALTSEGADIALNVAGGGTLTPTIAATRVGGRVHQVGYAADRISPLDIFTALERATSIRIATAGSRASFEAMIRAMQQHAIRPAIDRAFDLRHLDDALDYLASGGHLGKVIVNLNF